MNKWQAHMGISVSMPMLPACLLGTYYLPTYFTYLPSTYLVDACYPPLVPAKVEQALGLENASPLPSQSLPLHRIDLGQTRRRRVLHAFLVGLMVSTRMQQPKP